MKVDRGRNPTSKSLSPYWRPLQPALARRVLAGVLFHELDMVAEEPVQRERNRQSVGVLFQLSPGVG